MAIPKLTPAANSVLSEIKSTYAMVDVFPRVSENSDALKLLKRGFPEGEDGIARIDDLIQQHDTLSESDFKDIAEHARETAYEHFKENRASFPSLEAEQIRLLNIDLDRAKSILGFRWWLMEGLVVEMGVMDYPDKISSLRLPFTPLEWHELLNKEGKFLPVCCANISEIRDHLFTAMREDGYIDASSLRTVVRLAKDHNCGENDGPEHPLIMLQGIYEKIKDHLKGERKPVGDDPTNLKDAISILSNAFSYLAYSDFGPDFEETPGMDEKTKAAIRERAFSDHLEKSLAVVRIIPAIKTISEQIKTLITAPINAFAVIADDGRVAQIYSGHAIWQTRERCNEILKSWEESEVKEDISIDADVKEENEKSDAEKDQERISIRLRFRERFHVKPVRISLENGLEVLDEVGNVISPIKNY